MKYVVLFISLAVSGFIAVALLLRVFDTEEIDEWKLLAKSDLMHGPSISRVMFFDKVNGIAISPGAIAKTSDGGRRWVHVSPATGNGYYAFAFADAQRGIAVGSVSNGVPLALRTIDGGSSWEPLSFDTKLLDSTGVKITTFLDVCFDSTGATWIVGNKGIVSAVIQENKLNIQAVTPSNSELFSVACTDNGEIWAVGGEAVLSRIDGRWQPRQIDTKYRFGRVKSIGGEVWLLGVLSDADSGLGSGVVLRSKNSGQTWENKTPPVAGLQHDLFRQDGVLWLAGERGQIHYSKDNGESWVKSPAPSNSDLLSVFFLDSRSGWITGDRGTVLAYGH